MSCFGNSFPLLAKEGWPTGRGGACLLGFLFVMKILVDFSELLVSDVGVDLGGGD